MNSVHKESAVPVTPIFSIGYGARDMDAFLAALQSHQIHFLIDIRTSPYSSYKPEFSKAPLQETLESEGIRYIFMGDTLGGKPEDPACYTNGKVDYEKVAGQTFYQEGIERLHEASRQGRRVVLMCSEGKPENCHRAKLIGQTLNAQGLEVLHIDEVDAVITQQQVLLRLTDGQPSLFGDAFFSFTSRRRYRDE